MGLDKDLELELVGDQVLSTIREEAKTAVAEEMGTQPKIKPAKFFPTGGGGKRRTNILAGLSAWKERHLKADGVPNALNEIITILKSEKRFERKQSEADFKEDQAKAREAKENELEKVKPVKAVVATVQKAFTPIKGILDKVLNFAKFTALGAIVNNLSKWAKKYEENKDKFKLVSRFLKDWGPLLGGLGIIFLTPLGTFMGAMAGLLSWGLPILTGLIAANPWIPVVAGIGAASVWLVKQSEKAAENTLEDAGLSNASSDEQVEQLTTPEGLLQTLTRMLSPSSFSGDEDTQQFATGGFVSGPGGIDKVPARLTAGEFVMSKGAVQKWGEGTLAAMNAMGGGNNTPQITHNIQYADEGGKILDSPLVVGYNEGGKVERTDGLIQFLKANGYHSAPPQDRPSVLPIDFNREVQRPSSTQPVTPPQVMMRTHNIMLPEIDSRTTPRSEIVNGPSMPEFMIVADNFYRNEVIVDLEVADLMGV